MIVREMTWDDLEQVVEIENQNFSAPWTETGFLTFLMRQDVILLVAEEGEEIWGYCGVMLVAGEGDITNVSVKKEKQGQGIGSQLVDELIRRAEREGVRDLYLEVRAGNEAAQQLYAKVGFEQMGIRKNYYTNPTEDGITMCRKHSR